MKPQLTVQPDRSVLGALYDEVLASALAAIARNDGESLHDLRVALRRLAVLVKQLVPAGKRRKAVSRDIQALLQRSNQGRDAQVMQGWLKAQWPLLSDSERIGATLWQRQLRRQGQRPFRKKQLTTALQRLFSSVTRLSLPRSNVGTPLGVLVAQRLERQTRKLVALMSGDDASGQLHLIRLRAKTVRYLLLPFVDELESCAQAEAELRKIQALVGDWHDALVRQQSLSILLRREFAELSKPHKNRAEVKMEGLLPALPGLIALMRFSVRDQQRALGRAEQNFLYSKAAHLASLLTHAAGGMRNAATTMNDSGTM